MLACARFMYAALRTLPVRLAMLAFELSGFCQQTEFPLCLNVVAFSDSGTS